MSKHHDQFSFCLQFLSHGCAREYLIVKAGEFHSCHKTFFISYDPGLHWKYRPPKPLSIVKEVETREGINVGSLVALNCVGFYEKPNIGKMLKADFTSATKRIYMQCYDGDYTATWKARENDEGKE